MSFTVRAIAMPEHMYEYKCPYPMTPTRICVHNTANDAPAINEITYMQRNTNYTSFHWAIDDVEAIQGISMDRNAFHAGDGANGVGNREAISIEICYSLSGGDRFTQAEINGAELVARLLKQYGWGINKVTKHQDYSNKYCPHRTLDLGWSRFLRMVESFLNGETPSVTPEPEKPSGGNQSTHEVALDVIAGKYGNGADRKTNLANAGYDYNEVQAEVDRIYGVGGTTTPTPAPSGKTNEQLAQEVLRGDWGNGQERRDRLESAGYSYEDVMYIVNGGAVAPAPAPTPSASISDVAQAVIRGDYGNGADRRANLENAGYNYNEVQAEVDRIYAGGSSAPAPAPSVDIDSIAQAVIRGDFGNGGDRRNALVANYGEDVANQVQARVNELLA